MTSNLQLGQPIPHAATVTSQGTAAASYSATNHAAYAVTIAGATNAVSLTTSRACVRFVSVTNVDAGSQRAHVNVGNTVASPPAATVGSEPVMAGQTKIFEIPEGGNHIGGQGLISCIATAGGCNIVIAWIP